MQLLDNGRGRASEAAGKGGDGGEGEALSVIVADLCGRAGLALTDLGAAELTEVVPGYVIGRQTTVRGALEPFAQAYFFDGVESDDVLRFRKCGQAPGATIEQSDLVPLDEGTGEAWRERRTQEVELPERIADIHAGHWIFGSPAAKISKLRRLRAPELNLRGTRAAVP